MSDVKKIYAVIDTNVLVSALFSRDGSSKPAKVIEAVLRGVITPLYNSEIIEEYYDVLSRDKFKFPKELIDNLLSVVTEYGAEPACVIVSDESFVDSDDVVFYEVAMGMEGSYLVTGNIKHFPRRPFVVTPTQMVEILQSRDLL